MDDAEIREAFELVIAGGVEQAAATRGLLAIAGEQRKRINALEEAWGDTLLEVGSLTRRSRLVANMKAATITLTCLKCGAEFAREAGPQLCGPCWCDLGKPDRYLATVPPNHSTERNEPA